MSGEVPGDIPNFGWVTPWLARGGHPNPAGFAWLAQQGITTIVNLRSDDHTEAALADVCRFTPVHIPVADGAAPSHDQARAWLALCAQAANRPLFLHCRGGKGRTSTFCMLVRLEQGWTLAASMQEAIEQYAFDPALDAAQVQFLNDWNSQSLHRVPLKFD